MNKVISTLHTLFILIHILILLFIPIDKFLLW